MEGNRPRAPLAFVPAPDSYRSPAHPSSARSAGGHASTARRLDPAHAGPRLRLVSDKDDSPRPDAAGPVHSPKPTADQSVRWSLIERVHAEIVAGVYLTEGRLKAALDALIEELA